MTANQTLPIFITLLIYLVGLGFLLNAIGDDVLIDATYTEKSIPTGVSGNILTGFETEDTIVGNIVTGINSLPTWLNVIFITIPVILLIIIGLLLIIHG